MSPDVALVPETPQCPQRARRQAAGARRGCPAGSPLTSAPAQLASQGCVVCALPRPELPHKSRSCHCELEMPA